MRILVIGDSVGLPRFHRFSEEVELPYDYVYPEQLRRLLLAHSPGEDVLLLNQCRHANTSHSLRSGVASEVSLIRPDILILQLGMVDLWPSAGRNVPAPIPEMEGRDPWISPEQLHENFSRFLDFCSVSQSLSVIIVNVPRVSHEQYERYPAVLPRTQSYNRLLRDVANRPGVYYVDAFQLSEQLGAAAFGSDGIHPTREASLVLAENIFNQIIKLHRLGHEAALPLI